MKNKFTRQVAMVLTAVMLLLFVSPAVSAKAAGTVTRSLVWNKMTTGTLSGDGNSVYEYSFSLKRSGRAKFFVSANNYTYVMVYDESNNELIKWGDKGDKTYIVDLLAGNYTVKIAWGEYDYDSNFSFMPRFEASGETKQEFATAKNNEASTATAYTVGKIVKAQLAANDHVDKYKFYVSKTGYISIIFKNKFNYSSLSLVNAWGDDAFSQDIDEMGTYKYECFVKKGLYYLTIEGGNSTDIKYTGTYSIQVTAPSMPATRITKASNLAKNSALVTWTASQKLDGYQIQYSVNSAFKSGYTKTLTYRDSRTNRATLRKLRKGATYYVRVRGFKRSADQMAQYSTWSKSVKVKIVK